MKSDYAKHDEALALLSGLGPDLKNGFTSHVPMVAEALAAMGETNAAVSWVAKHRKTVCPFVEEKIEVSADNWRSMLGARGSFAGWRALFVSEIARDGWRVVCDRWALRLAPGFAASATHGVIRVGHAVRALENAETQIRLLEFADGLALWASTYAELPGGEGNAPGMLSPVEALAQITLIPEMHRRNDGAITTALKQLTYADRFELVISSLDVQKDVKDTAFEVAEAFARVVVDQVRTPTTAIVFTHGVTGAAAVLNLIPVVREVTARALVRYAWQCGAALVSAYSKAPLGLELNRNDPPVINRVRRAVQHGDDHVIKLTEACLTLNSKRPSAAYLLACDVVAKHLPEERP